MRILYKSKRTEDNGRMKIHIFEGEQNIRSKRSRGLMPEEPVGISEGTHPLTGDFRASLDERHDSGTGSKCLSYDGDKRYMGVKVKMPVREILRNIRIAKGMDPKEIQGNFGKTSIGDKKRVNTRGDRRCNKRKHPTPSLEELAIILEVLNEDLKDSESYSQYNMTDVSKYSPESSWNSFEPFQHSYPTVLVQENVIPQQALNNCMSQLNLFRQDTPVPPLNSQVEYVTDESDGSMPSPYSSSDGDYQMPSTPGYFSTRPQSSSYELDQDGGCDYSPESQERFRPGCLPHWSQDWNSTEHFWNRVQSDESLLMGVSDPEFLATDNDGRT
ncbi:hypothetical protein DPEC_G00241570 [Dallia pectoralis]|uniref:Uncharacterized protein n=1 Tax=Dallia pectoralis TaxID=75939 RepID=A0ACC2FUT3_DALPE|nr:hypothetical protein DPEC_G00241570 [Dallia pectoralis]